MQINLAGFTPTSGFVGGLILGLASVLLMLFNGRIAGITGIIGGILRPHAGDIAWRWCFVLGLVLSPIIYGLFMPLAPISVTDSGWVLAVAGLLVGYGTRIGAGCTSGHGICGNSRLSVRSMVATVTFILAGMVIVTIMKHLVG